MILGEPTTGLSPNQPPEVVLRNEIELKPVQVQELLDYLQSNEKLLQDIAEQEKEDRSETLAKIYQILLNQDKSEKKDE